MLTAADGHGCWSDLGVLPSEWQQFFNPAYLVRLQPGQHILEIGIWVAPLEVCGGIVGNVVSQPQQGRGGVW